MGTALAVTKIIVPSKRAGLLHRPQLVDFIHQHIERKLILVSAAAGYGKTSLLIDFARDTALPVCWYALESSDGDPKIFLEYLIASLRRQFPNFGERTARLIEESALIREADVTVGSLVTEIFENIPGYFVLVLDDYQLIEEAEPVNHILDALLRLLPENMHIIIAGRTLPKQLTLTRLTARQEIAGLGMNELKFSSAEIRALVRQNYQVDLSENDASELAKNSEGWVTGILLTTHSLWKGLFRSLVSASGSHSQLFHYLASEVFDQQAPELQDFLLQSSILSQINADIGNELFAMSTAFTHLRTLEERNLFITRVDGEESWYRYHHLFQEFLETRLRESAAARWDSLHRRAAHWFEERRNWEQAIRHYMKISAFGDSAQLVSNIAKETFDAGHWTTLAKWIDELPAPILENYTSLLLWRARIWVETGNLIRAMEIYSQVMTHYEKTGDKEGIGETLVRQAVCLRIQGNYDDAIKKCQTALTFLGDLRRREQAEAFRTIGISSGRLGNLQESVNQLKTALSFYDVNTDHADVALIYQDLGVTLRTIGDLGAQKYFHGALDHWRLANNTIGLVNTLNSIGVGYYRQGNYAAAIETLQSAQVEAHRSGQLRIEAYVLASLGDVYRDQAGFARSQLAYQSAYEISRQINEGFILTYSLCALGEIFNALGDPETANKILSQALAQAQSHHSNYEIALAKTALGIFSCASKNLTEAETHLNQAVEIFEQGGAKRDSARAHLHLAKTNFLQRNYRQANQHLRATAELGQQLEEDQFIVGDRQSVLPLVKYAVSKKIGNGYFARALEKIKTLPMTPKETDEIATSGPFIKANAFGNARVTVNDRQLTNVDWDSATAKELFFLLLAHPNGLRKEEILEKLWQNISSSKANAIFHSSSHRARRAVSSHCIVYEDGVYRLNEELRLWDDVSEFNALLENAHRAESEDAREEFFRQAIALYQGDYFEDSYGDWTIPIRSTLCAKYLDALYALAQFYIPRSQFDQAIQLLEKMIEKDPHREDIFFLLMRLRIKSGDRSGAIQTFKKCAQALEELNLTPGPETRNLYEHILKGSNSS